MSASSGLKGDCGVCKHSYNEHNRHKCKGSDKKKVQGKYTFEKCKTWWYVCQHGGHDFAGERADAYMVCISCEAHPGGGPDGSGPDGTFYTPSAEESITMDWSPWEWVAENNQWRRYRVSNGKYEYEWRDPEPSPSSTSDQAVAGHSRVDSQDSEDPLAWSNDRYEKETGDIGELTENLAKTKLDKGKEIDEKSTEPTTWSEWEWNETYNCYSRYRNGQNGTEWEYGKRGKDKGKGKGRR
jgi:hypothetical protein